jgi:hypothetical protein
MCKCGITKYVVIVTLIVGGYLIWKTLPEHKRVFWRNFLKQIPNLPARYMV